LPVATGIGLTEIVVDERLGKAGAFIRITFLVTVGSRCWGRAFQVDKGRIATE
jgi:hypothetical protein